ncbi:class IIb bacteriocin, lactobin A/cerein 7B family [Oceanospirillum maris]|jgi:lactobin A/cerein 7B family class IIb bacteriocin|nr:class IIb bacteriocin, lactobin A/cerein 7B family [Oceanospirillum maris]
MREITIQELEVVSGGVAPIIVAGAVILGKAAVGATAGALGYLTTNSK